MGLGGGHMRCKMQNNSNRGMAISMGLTMRDHMEKTSRSWRLMCRWRRKLAPWWRLYRKNPTKLSWGCCSLLWQNFSLCRRWVGGVGVFADEAHDGSQGISAVSWGQRHTG